MPWCQEMCSCAAAIGNPSSAHETALDSSSNWDTMGRWMQVLVPVDKPVDRFMFHGKCTCDVSHGVCDHVNILYVNIVGSCLLICVLLGHHV